VFLSGSAVGIYGNRADEELTEDSAPGTGFLPDLCVAWEKATAPASDAGIRVAHLRTGIVLSSAGGALRKQLLPFKLGLGGRSGNGRQWQSWISITDEVRAIIYLLTAEVAGPVNLTAPTPVTNADFVKALGSALHRPTLLPIPMFAPKLALGEEPPPRWPKSAPRPPHRQRFPLRASQPPRCADRCSSELEVPFRALRASVELELTRPARHGQPWLYLHPEEPRRKHPASGRRRD
jgi:nucleoside-diphosphate-sugar epimerase